MNTETHTSLEGDVRKKKLFKQSVSSGGSKNVGERWQDLSELFWMGELKDISLYRFEEVKDIE